jgi:hypothetical protein
MAGRRHDYKPEPCEVVNHKGYRCNSNVARGWARCMHHTFKGAQEFATELADGADIPNHLSRHEIFGLGIYVAEGIADGHVVINRAERNDDGS